MLAANLRCKKTKVSHTLRESWEFYKSTEKYLYFQLLLKPPSALSVWKRRSADQLKALENVTRHRLAPAKGRCVHDPDAPSFPAIPTVKLLLLVWRGGGQRLRVIKGERFSPLHASEPAVPGI